MEKHKERYYRYDRYRATLNQICIRCKEANKCKNKKCEIYKNVEFLVDFYHKVEEKYEKTLQMNNNSV